MSDTEDTASWYARLWAKSDKNGGPGHSLLAHMIDVGLVARALLNDSRFAVVLEAGAKRMGISLQQWRACIELFVALHDLGKATPSFQQKWPPGAPFEALSRPFGNIAHGMASAILLNAAFRSMGWSGNAASVMANAVGIHHGSLIGKGYYEPSNYVENDVAVDDFPWRMWHLQLIEALGQVFTDVPKLNATQVAALDWAWLAGLTSVADWIGSSLEFRSIDVDELDNYVALREEDIEARLEEIGWTTSGPWWDPPDVPSNFEAWFGFPARALQKATAEVSQGLDDGPSLLIVEAPTGEGKTEAALYHAVQSQSSRGVYIGMPTQATSNALHVRVQDFVDRHKCRATELALAHSGARVSLGGNRKHLVLEDELEGEMVATSWFSSGRRELLAELGVGTVDQALLAVLPVKHHTVRIWALTGKTVILDEVHAYDMYTYTLIEQLVKWLAALNCRVIVLSATLPASSRVALGRAFQVGAQLPEEALLDADYPRITALSRHSNEAVTFEADKKRAKSVAIKPVGFTESEMAAAAMELAARGGAVCVIVNTVKRAQAIYAYCREHYPDPLLIHAAFPADLRNKLEGDLLSRYGPDSQGPRNGIVIGTQVLEQSLDVDFDVMLTDLAPVDLLIQRIGRMHRHQRSSRSGHDKPVVYISGLQSETTDAPDEKALESVYEAYVLWRTWAALFQKSHLQIPEEVDSLVQVVYGDAKLDALDSYREEVDLARHKAENDRVIRQRTANMYKTASPHERAERAWNLTGADDDELSSRTLRIPTRLGDRAVSVIPIVETGDRWRLFGEEADVSNKRFPGNDWLDLALSKQLRIGNPQHLVQALDKVNGNDWWQAHRELRFKIPLLLNEDGSLKVDGTRILDLKLGLSQIGRRDAHEVA